MTLAFYLPFSVMLDFLNSIACPLDWNQQQTHSFVVSIILQPIKAFAKPFVNDMAVHSMTWDDHLKHLDQLLRTVQKYGLTLSLMKCTFVQRSAIFVGHRISSGRIEPDPWKLKCIGDLQPPKTKKEVRSVIGFFSYFRNFIPGLAETAHSFTGLTQKNQPTKV